MTLSVSVALCTHNGARYIEEQLRSILEQSVLPVEVVVSDDASSDDTLKRVESVWERYATDATTLRILHNEKPLGVARNFEQAIGATTAELVALSDQDDSWHPHRIESASRRFQQHPELLLCFSDARLVDRDGLTLGVSLFEALEFSADERAQLVSGRGFDALMHRNLVTGATTMIRRSLLESAAPFPEPWVHDEWLAVIAAARGHIEQLDEELIDYRQHGANQIGVRKLGVRGKLARLVEPRGLRNDYLLDRATVLLHWLELDAEKVGPARIGMAREKVAHLSLRRNLPERRLSRLLPVFRETATGRYRSYSRGVGDILRDLLQPAR